MEARSRLGTSAFDARYTDDNGNPSNWTNTLTRIRKDKEINDQDIVHQAKERYGAKYDELFSYQKDGCRRLMTRTDKIAKKMRELAG